MTEIRCFQEIITKLKDMRVDPTEYNCLKAIVLFKTGKQKAMPAHMSELAPLLDKTRCAPSTN